MQANDCSKKNIRVFGATLLFAFVASARSDAAVAPKDNAPGTNVAQCQCNCIGPLAGDIGFDTYNAPFGDTKNCSMLDNRTCRIIRADGTVRNGTTGACEPRRSTSPGKIGPVQPTPRK